MKLQGLILALTTLGLHTCAFTPSLRPPVLSVVSLAATTTVEDESESVPKTAAVPQAAQRRILGSQENLMLPRQYSPGKDVFPQMNHVSVAVLSSTPSEEILRQAIDDAMASHPLLRCHIEGDGEPDERIDLFQMVRKGEPQPCTFCSSSTTEFTSKDVLSVVDVFGGDRVALDASWKTTFQKDIDDGSWCTVEKGPLWKLEWHRYQEDSNGIPCALVFSFNHAISDQSSANRLIDQIVGNMASIEADGSITKPGKKQDMPVSVEDSVLGLHQRWNDVLVKGISPGTIAYVAGKAAEGFKSPVILPDSENDGSSVMSSLSIISGNAAGGEDAGSEDRKSTLQFRTLSAATTSALLNKCRENQVSITNALTAATTLASTDFIDGGNQADDGKRRNYKVLQSLDLRRFGAQLDQGKTVGCLAGSMDLMHGPFPDYSGKALRENPPPEGFVQFWRLAQDGLDQTRAFVASEGPKHAMRVFDFAMTIADLNNLVYLTAQSKDTQGRAYSAGVTNNGVYERQEAFEREGESARAPLKTKHGRYNVDDIFFGVSHARSGCLYQLSCLTLGGEMKLTFHPAMPIVSEETNRQFADAFVELIEAVACN
ncbi:expressed unknown protein [Seminavis robusta]|uniref:Uncharacterized protein n=1 Tax=Seminavis robusta TaxID=568900 RepID=A0A9N8HJQ0_9STRA|nr:expressed unknown protein [Seminavis robusta]|eukprot:Sro565_g167540.1 n/a (600) ;mRNA; r:11537-13433